MGARARIREAGTLLRWLSERGLKFATCTQGDIDLWLSQSKTTAYTARYFVRWACRRGIAESLSIPDPQTENSITPAPDDERWQTIERLLVDDTIATPTRIAGLLVTLYAQQLTRIRDLSDRDFQRDGEDLLVLLGDDWLPLCPALADLIGKTLELNRKNPRSVTHDGRILVFPSRVLYGEAVREQTLARAVSKLGVDVRSARLGGERELFRKIRVPQVVAQLIGINVITAVKKAYELGTSYSRYAIAKGKSQAGGTSPRLR
jgi:hypothetical protein